MSKLLRTTPFNLARFNRTNLIFGFPKGYGKVKLSTQSLYSGLIFKLNKEENKDRFNEKGWSWYRESKYEQNNQGKDNLSFKSSDLRMLLGAVTLSTLSESDDNSPPAVLPNKAHVELPNTSLPPLTLAKSIYYKISHVITFYIIEPIRTGVRFIYLVYCFLPVVFSIPALFIGEPVLKRDNELSGRLWFYEFLKRRLEKGGATFIKLAQWAASRSDIFPRQLCLTLSQLQASVNPHSLEDTRATIRKEFGLDIEDLFDDFEPVPMGVGAIAQVYRAKPKRNVQPRALKDSFQTELSFEARRSPRPLPDFVAIKVLHPNVLATVKRDLRIMNFFATMLNIIPTLKWLSLPDEVSTFGEMMRAQMDLRNEAENLLLFRSNFSRRYNVRFPRPLPDWVSKEVLVEKYEFGVPMKHFLHSNQLTPYHMALSAIGLDAFLHMLIFDNFVHADLHAGNIMVKFYKPTPASIAAKIMALATGSLVRDESEEITKMLLSNSKPEEFDKAIQDLYHQGYYPQLVFLDAGLVTTLNEKNRVDFLDLFRAVAEFDGYKAGQLMVERCRSPEQVIDGDIFALKMQHLVLNIKKRTFQLASISISDILGEVMSMVRNHQVKLEGDFVNVVISILILEGIGRSLNPDLDLFKMALPILRDLGTSDRGRALQNIPTLPGSSTWWIKLWFQLEARQVLSDFSTSYGSIDPYYFGPFTPNLIDL